LVFGNVYIYGWIIHPVRVSFNTAQDPANQQDYNKM